MEFERKDVALLASGMGIGGGLMYLLDPNLGKRRRHLIADQVTHAGKSIRRGAPKAFADLGHRVQGVVLETKHRFSKEDVSDDIIESRVRSSLGRLISHPSAIEVKVEQGRVILSGPILTHETEQMLRGVEKVRGVKSVKGHLETYKSAENISALQGGRSRKARPALLQDSWAPAIRLSMGSLGAGLVIYGFKKGYPVGCAVGTLGAGLLLRATTNLPIDRLTGIGAGRRAVTAQKTLDVAAPIEEDARLENVK